MGVDTADNDKDIAVISIAHMNENNVMIFDYCNVYKNKDNDEFQTLVDYCQQFFNIQDSMYNIYNKITTTNG